MSIADDLHTLRKQNRLTQRQMASILGVSRSTISSWECGRTIPRYQSLHKISVHFGVSLPLNFPNPATISSPSQQRLLTAIQHLSPEEAVELESLLLYLRSHHETGDITEKK